MVAGAVAGGPCAPAASRSVRSSHQAAKSKSPTSYNPSEGMDGTLHGAGCRAVRRAQAAAQEAHVRLTGKQGRGRGSARPYGNVLQRWIPFRLPVCGSEQRVIEL